MLKRLRLKDFKSFVDEQVTLAPLTLLVGANASGKSNFLDALQFLHGLTKAMSLTEVINGEEQASSDTWPGIRGREQEVARVGTASFMVESDWSVHASSGQTGGNGKEQQIELLHKITCQIEPHPHLQAESLTRNTGKVVFETGVVKGSSIEIPSWRIRFRSRVPGQAVIRPLSGKTSHSVLRQFVAGSAGLRLTLAPPEPARYVASLVESFERISVLNIQPAAMRGYGRRGAPLGVDGSNLSGVLADLCDEPEAKRSFVDWLSEFCAPEITDLDFVEIKELGDVMAMFVEKGGKRISARSLSDGTLRFLGVLLALRTAEPGSVLLMEEVDTGLHPTRIRLLLEYLETVTRERDIQVIATTHSPVILQWLSPEALRSTLVFGRVPEHEGTLVRRLGDLPHFDEVTQHKGIDELFTTGWMEMAL